VLKRLDVMGGEYIFRVRADDPNRNVIVETMAQGGARSVMAQRFIPEIREGDKRILLIDGEVVPWALARIPRAGETRGNLAAGGTARAQPLSARDREIAETIAPWARDHGIFLAGLDVIGDCLTEINVTSPTGFQEITAQTGHDVAAQFIAAVERVCQIPQLVSQLRRPLRRVASPGACGLDRAGHQLVRHHDAAQLAGHHLNVRDRLSGATGGIADADVRAHQPQYVQQPGAGRIDAHTADQ